MAVQKLVQPFCTSVVFVELSDPFAICPIGRERFFICEAGLVSLGFAGTCHLISSYQVCLGAAAPPPDH
jgi:hypothetical protein